MGTPVSPDLVETLRQALQPHYSVERALGAGGMATVFLGRDLTLDRPVAIKVISSDLAASPALRQRFLHEARTVAKLRHPNIVDVYAAGEVSGLLYFVMEYVPGESLRGLLEREGFCRGDRATTILRDLADALAYAHAKGVIHRDIKPENVLLDGRTGHAMLTDFGVAQALTGADDRITSTGLIVGSPRYMSPEQAAGERSLDGRSDIYSLGLVGYEMFAGGAAFAGPDAVSVLAKQMTERPAPLATKAKDMPPAVAAAIERALEKSPYHRWQSAADFARALTDPSMVGDAAPAEAVGPATPPERAATAVPWWRRRVVQATGAGVLLVLLAIAMWPWVGGRSGAPRGVDPRKSFFVAPFENQTGDRALVWLREGSVNMLTLNLSAWRDLTVVDYERTLDLLRDAGLDDDARIGLEDARRLARRAGAWTAVLGQITRGGDSLRVVARAYDVGTQKQVKQLEVSAPVGADPRGLFDRMARELLDLAGAPPMTPELAKTTTTSLEAYREYLAGVQALNRWELVAADSALGRATRADSTFALAYYKRALARGWNRTFLDTSNLALARAGMRHAGRLPPRERGLVESHYAMTQGFAAQTRGDFRASMAHLADAERLFRALLLRDSTDAEAWYGLGDAIYHMGVRGMPGNEIASVYTRSLRAFNRAIELDSTFHLAYSHNITTYQEAGKAGSPFVLTGDSVAHLANDSAARAYGLPRIAAARREASGRAVRDARHWVFLDPDAPAARSALVDALANSGQHDSAAAALRQALERPAARSPEMAYYLPQLEMQAGSPTALATLRAAMRDYGADTLRAAPSTRRFAALVGALNVAAYAGALKELDEMLALLARVEPVTPGANLPTDTVSRTWRALLLAGMGLDEPAVRRGIARGIQGVDALPPQVAAAARPGSRLILYTGYLTTRDTVYFATFRRWGDRSVPTELEALAALDAGDTVRAMRLAAGLRSADATPVIGPVGATLASFGHAQLFLELGDLRRALATYESIDPKRFNTIGLIEPRWPLYVRSFLARGQLYERLGERLRAQAAYGRFLELWEEADPRLQPQLRLAREAIARLKDVAASVAPEGARRGN